LSGVLKEHIWGYAGLSESWKIKIFVINSFRAYLKTVLIARISDFGIEGGEEERIAFTCWLFSMKL